MGIHNSIATKFLRVAFTIYFFIAVILTAIQLYAEFSQERKRVKNDLKTLQIAIQPLIETALQKNNYDALKEVTTKILAYAQVVSINIQSKENKSIYQGSVFANMEETDEQRFINPFDDKHIFSISFLTENPVATVQLFSSYKIILDRISYSAKYTIINTILKAFLLWIVLYFVIRRILSRPLAVLEMAAEKLDMNHLENINLNISVSGSSELQHIENSFNGMVEKLANQIQINHKVTQTFEKFVPKQFLDRIALEGLENIALGEANTEMITVLFSDIRHFTDLTENMNPQEVLNFLNSYLDRVNKPIHNNFGFIDKFLGDGIMALFDHPDDSATNAINAAIDMIEAVKLYNEHRSSCNYPAISIGIGLHTGEVIIGTIGSKTRMESTVLGDVVNLSSRIQELTKYYDTQIIISSETFERINDNAILCRELDFITVKGKEHPTSIFEVFNCDPIDIREKKLKMLEPYYEGLMRYYSRDWDAATLYFQQCVEIYEDDLMSKMYIDRCHQYKKYPPPEDWDGALRLNLEW